MRFVKFTESSELIFETLLFSKLHNKFTSINRCLVHCTTRYLKRTENKEWIELLVKSTEKLSCKNNYRTSCRFYDSLTEASK